MYELKLPLRKDLKIFKKITRAHLSISFEILLIICQKGCFYPPRNRTQVPKLEILFIWLANEVNPSNICKHAKNFTH